MTDIGFTGENRGNLVQAHMIVGDVHFHRDRPQATSSYLHDVRSLVPGQLDGRARELADLAAFVTAPEVDHWYQWWQAPAWAGKTALFVHFVLDPPAGVRVVSFFVTARHKGNDDRAAFVSTVVDQLAELLGVSVPPGDVAASERHLRTLLRSAAEECAQRGERLVLVVDGLDEDRSADGYSIAGLLPAQQVGDMRVVVSGRPNPALPADVDEDHPLRDGRAVRRLSVSPIASVVRRDAQRELRRYVNGSELQKDLLGFVAAAGGGLTVDDLARLTGHPVRRVQECLGSVYGRMFVRQSEHWTFQDVLILAHEELNSLALDEVGPQELARYRDCLHGWAAEYREGRWPDSTPHYLLRGYFRLLATIGDVPRMITYATDPWRYEQMRRRSGGDVTAVADIRRTMDLVETDMVAFARLAVHVDHLSTRNNDISAHLPALVACVHGHARGEQLARSIRVPRRQSEAVTELVRVIAADGDYKDAERLARTLASPDWALAAIADALVEAGRLEEASALARAMQPRFEIPVLWGVLKSGGDTAMVDEIERAVTLVNDGSWRPDAMRHLAVAAAFVGDVGRAENALRAFPPPWQMETLGLMAAALVEKCDIESARAVAERIGILADGTHAPWPYLSSLADIARALARGGGDEVWLMELTVSMERLAGAITEPHHKGIALFRIATVLAAGGRAADAERCLLTSTEDNKWWVLAGMVREAAQAGHVMLAEKWASEIPSSSSWYGSMVQSLAEAGMASLAARLVDTIVYADNGDDLWCAIGVAVARAGDRECARRMLDRVEAKPPQWRGQHRHDTPLNAAVRVIVAAGDGAAAERVTGLLSGRYAVDEALVLVIKAVARAGDSGRAEELVRRISTLRGRADTLVAVANSVDSMRKWRSGEEYLPVSYRLSALIERFEFTREFDESLFSEMLDVFSSPASRHARPLARLLVSVAATGSRWVGTWVQKWADRLVPVVDGMEVEVERACAWATLGQVVGFSGRRHSVDRADALFQRLDEFDQSKVAMDLVTALLAVGEVERATSLARGLTDPVGRGMALALVAARSAPQDAMRLVVEAVRASNWAVPMAAPVWHAEPVVEAIHRERAVIQRMSAGE